MKRRAILKGLSLMPFGTGLAATMAPLGAATAAPASKGRNIFKELGIRTFINAAGTYTAMTGSLMQDEVVAAIQNASKEFCLLDELQDKVGEKIAALVHAEAAVVTAGCFSAMTLGLAGVLTGKDQQKVEQLPHLAGTTMKSEVIMQKAHTIGYSHALTNTGCNIVYVETIADVEKAINDKTALLWFLNVQSDSGSINHEQWVALGRKYNIPTMIDIAADVPPVSNLWKFHDMGFDLVCVSGGKAMRGPQSAGILMGKKDLVAAARLSMPPRGSTIGRGMKVNKEEIIGMYVALDKFIHTDHEKLWKEWESRIATMEAAVKPLKGIATTIKVPPLGNVTPTLHITWDSSVVKLTTASLQENLRNGNPSIEVIGSGDNHITITAWVMQPGEEKLVAARLKEEFTKAV
ncbi:aminotransferase class V-fold PLP-dependent enzyme [Flavihumibacter fluvii]|uniref:aminotransferase class V-fold PLP-dependent enzyme n=1 Tax=Flavihumibacter fluvii TaxID=2838157 RepID=UPI001BDDD825|nr:aminotransferase class V-fold PLP-dependent enzyme [Flavihumibacter fluvii]ULQ50722.1 aminotransferase class V-fold PLP-dependent enzyme [Flavihumibacter fluvii]